jgi:hypothetical protein
LILLYLFLRPSFYQPLDDEWTAESYQYSKPTYYGAEERGHIIARKKINSQSHIDNPYEKYKDNALETACGDLRLIDVAIVLFTYYLVIVGWFAMRSADETAKRPGRAYVFGGSPFGTVKSEWVKYMTNRAVFPEARYFNDPRQMTVNNYGKTRQARSLR